MNDTANWKSGIPTQIQCEGAFIDITGKFYGMFYETLSLSNWNTSLIGEGQTNEKGAFKILLKIGFELLDGFDQLFIFVKCLDRRAESVGI